MNGKKAKEMRKLAYTFTQRLCKDQNIEHKKVEYIENTKNRKKIKRIKNNVDKKAVSDYEYNIAMGLPIDQQKEKEFYEYHDISLGTIKLLPTSERNIYQKLKEKLKKIIN